MLPKEPLEVRLRTYKPIAGSSPPHLDGILANAVCQSLELGWINVGEDEVLFVPTPLDVVEWIDGLPLWATNNLEAVDAAVRYTRYCQKSGDNPTTLPRQMAALDDKKPLRLPSSINGQYQHYLLPLRTEMADYWSTTCLGDQAEVERLLGLVSHVGKKRKPGWGAVQRWEVTPTSRFTLDRPRPAESGVYRSWTNPHWDDRLWRYCS